MVPKIESAMNDVEKKIKKVPALQKKIKKVPAAQTRQSLTAIRVKAKSHEQSEAARIHQLEEKIARVEKQNDRIEKLEA
jgi:hypothetical protein